jgi:hypothetical protein
MTAIPEATATPEEPATAEEAPAATPFPSPQIVAAWVLPDMQPRTDGFQTGSTDHPDQHDDDALAPGIQIAPNLADEPGARIVTSWLVVDAPGGSDSISEVRATVIAPDGRVLRSIAAHRQACLELGAAESMGGVLEAASHTAQIDSPTTTRIDGCPSTAVMVFSAEDTLSIADPVGVIQVVWSLVDSQGSSSTATTTFESLAISGLQIDVDHISFGTIADGADYAATGSAATPTIVRNTGNTTGVLTIQLSPLIGQSSGAQISEFGATLGEETLQTIAADTVACFSQPIYPGESKVLQFVIRPDGVPPDYYQGTLDLSMSVGCSP